MCKVCDNYSFNNVGVKFHDIIGGSSVYFTNRIGTVPAEEQFKFCPVCGKPLNSDIETPLTVADLRKVIQDHSTIWLENENGEHLASDELRYIDKKHDNCEISIMFPEKYPAISSMGITVILKDGENNG